MHATTEFENMNISEQNLSVCSTNNFKVNDGDNSSVNADASENENGKIEPHIIDDTIFVSQGREVRCQDAIGWLENYHGELPGSVFTSLPDFIEIREIFQGTFDEKIKQYQVWFLNAVELILSKLKYGQCAVFLQSDVRVIGNAQNCGEEDFWLDKSSLCSEAANNVTKRATAPAQQIKMLWHKICLVRALNSLSRGRPSYSHLVCFGKGADIKIPDIYCTPDVFDRGDMLWPKGIGLNAALVGCSYIKNCVKADCIIDPFCGVGTVLAVASAIGMTHTIGVDLSPKRCRKAWKMELVGIIQLLTYQEMRLYGLSNENIQHMESFNADISDYKHVLGGIEHMRNSKQRKELKSLIDKSTENKLKRDAESLLYGKTLEDSVCDICRVVDEEDALEV